MYIKKTAHKLRYIYICIYIFCNKDLVKLSNDIEECISLNRAPFDFFY